MTQGLATDLYQLTMFASYLHASMGEQATFSLFVRKLPPNRSFWVANGLEDAIAAVETMRFEPDDLDYLASLGFDDVVCDALAGFRFEGDIWAAPEGTVLLPGEPVVEVTAPLPQAQLVETALLNQVTYQSAIATKAARCMLAASGRASLVDFSLRRTHGMEAAMAAARAMAIAGFVATSNVEAARRLGIPPAGTMAHSYIEAFPDERSAFGAFARLFPERTTFLVDTFEVTQGLRAAIETSRSHGLAQGFGVRIDSGDLDELSREARHLLDQAGLSKAAIVASGNLDEFEVKRLLDSGAPIDVFGLGTRVGTSSDAPYLDTAYKLVQYGEKPVMKLSEGKETLPGPKQVYRSDEGDLLTVRSDPPPFNGRALLEKFVSSGSRVRPPEPWQEANRRLWKDLEALPPAARQIESPAILEPEISPALHQLTEEVRSSLSSGN